MRCLTCQRSSMSTSPAGTPTCGAALMDWSASFSTGSSWTPLPTLCFILRSAYRPLQGTVLGLGRVPAAVQAPGARQIPMAQEQGGGAKPQPAAVPLASGRAEHPPAQGASAGQQHRLFLAENSGETPCVFLLFRPLYAIIFSIKTAGRRACSAWKRSRFPELNMSR